MSEDPARRAWEAMRVLVLEHDRRKEVTAALDMSFIRVKALRVLADGPLTLRGLAAQLMIDAPYATVIVDDLEQRGLVTRTVHPDDRRARLVALTGSGHEAVELSGDMLNTPPAVLSALPRERLAAVAAVLEEAVGQATA